MLYVITIGMGFLVAAMSLVVVGYWMMTHSSAAVRTIGVGYIVEIAILSPFFWLISIGSAVLTYRLNK